ncbi:MAG: hypothetical protein HFJ58_01445 [Clostridia bacterium]|nr:hypothetical protein [Clostridia bacterium]
MRKIDIENAYFHGLAGGIPFWDEDRVIATGLKQLKEIIERKCIYSRRILKEKYGVCYDEKNPIYNGEEYISVCIKHPEDNEFLGQFENTDSAFLRYVRFKIGIVINNNIAHKCKFREGEYKHLPGERQVLDSIDMSDFLGVVVGLTNRTKIISKIETILDGTNIPIMDFKGNIITDVRKSETEDVIER